jgi:hypothetical protein
MIIDCDTHSKPGTRNRKLILGGDIGLELALEHRDLVFQEELAFLEALQLQLVLGGAMRQTGDDVIEVSMLYLQLVNSLLESLDVGGLYHGRHPPHQRYARDSSIDPMISKNEPVTGHASERRAACRC